MIDKYGYEYIVSKELTKMLKGRIVVAKNTYGHKMRGQVKRAYVKVYSDGHTCIGIMLTNCPYKLMLDSLGDVSIPFVTKLRSIVTSEVNTYWECKKGALSVQDITI